MLLDQPATLVPSYVAWKRQSDEMFCVIKKMLKGCSIFQPNLAEAYELIVSLIIQFCTIEHYLKFLLFYIILASTL